MEKRRREKKANSPQNSDDNSDGNSACWDPGLDDELARLAASHYRQEVLPADVVPYISRWYHVVLKQVVSPLKAPPNIDWLYVKLRKKIPREKIQASLQRLLRLRLFRVDPDSGRWIPEKGNIQTPSGIPSSAIRMHHREMLRRAMDSLEEDSVDEREFTTLTFRASPESIRQMKKRILEFRESFDQEFEELSSTEVFQLNVQLFRHTT